MLRPGLVPLLCVLSTAAFAAPDDADLLAPLTPSQPEPKKAAPAAKPASKKPAPAAKAKSLLQVSLKPAVEGARVFVDDRDRGLLPLAALEVSPGPHRVVVRRPGYADAAQKVTVPAGQRKALVLKLEAVAGVLRLKGSPLGADVELDGVLVGALPLPERAVPPGPHQVVVRATGHAPATLHVVMRAGRDEVREVTLVPLAAPSPPVASPLTAPPSEPLASEAVSVPPGALPDRSPDAAVSGTAGSQPFFSRWYVWVGIGVIAGGIAAGSWALAANRPQTPQPSQVCAGACDAVLNAPAGAF